MSGEAAWRIAKSRAITPPTGSVYGDAYLVRVQRGSSRREVIVEFADSSAVVSNGYAEEVTRRFLRDDEPPQHLVVETAGTVRVEIGPRKAADDAADSRASPSGQSPHRARGTAADRPPPDQSSRDCYRADQA
jgi:hypothetical protein